MNGTLGSLYRLFLSNIATRGRLIGLVALGAVTILVGFAIGANDTADHLDNGTRMIAFLGLSLVTPVVALVLATSVLGDPNEDGTLVYLWLRPVARWQLAVAATLAALTVSMPVVLVPMTIAAAATKAGGDLVAGTMAASAVAVVAYTGIFTFLGLRVKRAMAWGLAYILVWEGFIARAGGGTGFLSVRQHTVSLLARMDDGPHRFMKSSMATAVLVPLLAAAIATYATTRRLQRQDVA
jgi:ABC-2 type transport system permease protein